MRMRLPHPIRTGGQLRIGRFGHGTDGTCGTGQGTGLVHRRAIARAAVTTFAPVAALATLTTIRTLLARLDLPFGSGHDAFRHGAAAVDDVALLAGGTLG